MWWCNFLVVLLAGSSSAIHEMPPKFDPNEIKVGMFSDFENYISFVSKNLCFVLRLVEQSAQLRGCQDVRYCDR